MNITKFFEANEDYYLKTDDDPLVKDQIHDLYIFNALAKFVKRGDLIVAASHEEIFLNVDPQDVYTELTSYELIRLIRCGLRYSEDQECFCMFV